MSVINLEKAKQQIRVTNDLEDALIQQYIEAAYRLIELKTDRKLFESQAEFDGSDLSAGQKLLIDVGVDQIALFLVGHFFENRESVVVSNGRVEAAAVPMTVDMFINSYRREGL